MIWSGQLKDLKYVVFSLVHGMFNPSLGAHKRPRLTAHTEDERGNILEILVHVPICPDFTKHLVAVLSYSLIGLHSIIWETDCTRKQSLFLGAGCLHFVIGAGLWKLGLKCPRVNLFLGPPWYSAPHIESWLVVFNVPSTARSFRDGTSIYCPLWRTWSSINTPFRPGIEPRAVAWQSITLPLRYTIS